MIIKSTLSKLFYSLKTLGTKGFSSIKPTMKTFTKNKEHLVEKIVVKNNIDFVKSKEVKIVKNDVVSYVSKEGYENIQLYISLTNNPVKKTSSNRKASIMNNYSTLLKKLSIAALFLLSFNISTVFAQPPAPTSGGDQTVCELSPIQTLTATATVGFGETLVWYDAATAGNVVASPTKNTTGSITQQKQSSYAQFL